MILNSQAPMRISFAGGGTDISPFANKYGGAVVSATIVRYARVKITDKSTGYISYPIDQSDASFIEKLASRFPPVSIELRVDAPPYSGLGASGAIGVAVLGCLNALKGDEPLNKNGIAELAYEIETQELGISGGRQDQYAAVYGGLNYMEFGDGRVNINPLEVSTKTLLSLQNSLLLVFTKPRSGSSGHIILDEKARVQSNDATTLRALFQQKELANEMRRVLRRGNLYEFGILLHKAWEVKKNQSPLTTNEYIDEIYDRALKAGALGGKIAGAGEGGYMLLFAPNSEGEVSEAMLDLGLITESVIFDNWGLRVWKSE